MLVVADASALLALTACGQVPLLDSLFGTVRDDKRARRVADLNGMHTVGSLGVLLLGKRRSLIPALKPLMQRMQEAGIYIGAPLMADVLQRAGET